MFESITHFFKKFKKSEKLESKSTAKERLHLVLAQDRANISADFLEMMKQEILEVIKKYIDIDEKAIDVRLTNKESEDGSVGAPALYANIPIITIKNEARKLEGSLEKEKITKEVKYEETTEILAPTVDSENNEPKELDDTNNNSLETELKSDYTKEEVNNVENKPKENEVDTSSSNIEKDTHDAEENDVKTDQVKSENDNMDEVDNEEKNS